MSRNNQSNRIIKWLVMAGDFIVLNAVMLAFAQWHWRMGTWDTGGKEIFILVNNIALMLSMLQFSTIIHLRLVNAGDILRRMVGLTMLQAVLAYLLLKVFATAIDKLLGDDNLAKQYAEAGHQRVVENFTIPKMMEKMNEVYKELERI